MYNNVVTISLNILLYVIKIVSLRIIKIKIKLNYIKTIMKFKYFNTFCDRFITDYKLLLKTFYILIGIKCIESVLL